VVTRETFVEVQVVYDRSDGMKSYGENDPKGLTNSRMYAL